LREAAWQKALFTLLGLLFTLRDSASPRCSLTSTRRSREKRRGANKLRQ
jgi:hypothetical protein